MAANMAAGPAAPCLSELGGLPGRNISLISGTRPCNRSSARTSTYTPQATAAFAIAITSMMVLTIVGNILVIMAVLTSRSLRGAQNLFLVSLAAADILVATLIIPFSLANELQGYWAFSSMWCEIYLALDVLFCTSSIVHLCAIALDRYLSISRPVSYGAKRTAARIKAAIIVVWLISAVISFPPLLTLDKSEGGEEACELNSERWYILYSTIGSFFAPCVIMILVYVRIYQIAKQHTRGPSGQKHKAAGGGNAGEPPGEAAGEAAGEATGEAAGEAAGEPPAKTPEQPTGDQGGTTSGRRAKLKKMSGSDSAPSSPRNPQSSVPGHAGPKSSPGPVRKSTSSPAIPQPEILSAAAAAPKESTSCSGSDGELETGDAAAQSKDDANAAETPGPARSKGFKGQVLNLACRYKSTMATSAGTKLVAEETPRTQGTPTARRKAMVNREKRFTFVLAVVMGVFVVCWFPFFFSYSLQAVCPAACSIPAPLFKFFFWIGYCNSCLNPVIYTVFNNDFRKAFKRILCRDTKGTLF